MQGKEWDRRGYKKKRLNSGEVIRTKTYIRFLQLADNISVGKIVSDRKKLAELLQVPYQDLLANLVITIEIERHPRNSRRFLKYFKKE